MAKDFNWVLGQKEQFFLTKAFRGDKITRKQRKEGGEGIMKEKSKGMKESKKTPQKSLKEKRKAKKEKEKNR